jgi:hypothetical protein
MERINVACMEGLSAYKLSHLVSSMKFARPNLRGQERPDKTKKAVLRALCDRYPNVWPSVADIAGKASCSVSQAQRVLRELEHKDRLIVDISTDQGKKGGRGKGCTVQYFIRDRKIFDIVHQQKYWAEQDKTRSCEDVEQTASPADCAGVGVHSITNTQSCENGNPVIRESKLGHTSLESSLNPVTMTDEPIRVLTEKVLTDKVEPVSEPSEPSTEQAAAQTAALGVRPVAGAIYGKEWWTKKFEDAQANGDEVRFNLTREVYEAFMKGKGEALISYRFRRGFEETTSAAHEAELTANIWPKPMSASANRVKGTNDGHEPCNVPT